MVGLILLFLAASIVILTLVVLNILNKGLAQYEERYLQKSADTLTEMFIFVSGKQILLITVILSAIFAFLGWLIFNWYLGVLTAAAGLLLPISIVNAMRARRIRRFDEQLVDALIQMSSAFRAGLSLLQAAQTIAEEMPNPIAQEFALFGREVKLGVSQEEALENMAKRVRSENLLLVVTATNVSRKLGGNLAEMFDTIATTVRDRFQMEGRVQALTSMGKLQGWIVGSMPIAMGVIFNFMRPDLMEPMLNHAFGVGLVISIIVMEVLGILLLRRIMTINF